MAWRVRAAESGSLVGRGLSPSVLRALVLLAVLGTFVAFLPRLVDLDARVARAVLFARTCRTDAFLAWIVPAATAASFALAAVVAVVRLRHGTWRPVLAAVDLCLVGALLDTVLKHVFARDRPTMLAASGAGYSFPSGHAMNVALAAIAIAVLVTGVRRACAWRLLAAFLAIVVAGGRVVQAHHWLSDVTGGVLVALTFAAVAWSSFRRFPVVAPIATAVALSTILAWSTAHPAFRVWLPSPTSALGIDLVELAPNDAGTFRLGLSPSSTVAAEGDGPGWIAVGGQPTDASPCVLATITVNDRALPSFVPFRGPREYRFALPPGSLKAGENRVTVEARDAAGRRRELGLRYVRVLPDPSALVQSHAHEQRASRIHG